MCRGVVQTVLKECPPDAVKMAFPVRVAADAWVGPDAGRSGASRLAPKAVVHDCRSAETGLAKLPSKARRFAEQKLAKPLLPVVMPKFALRQDLLSEPVRALLASPPVRQGEWGRLQVAPKREPCSEVESQLAQELQVWACLEQPLAPQQLAIRLGLTLVPRRQKRLGSRA